MKRVWELLLDLVKQWFDKNMNRNKLILYPFVSQQAILIYFKLSCIKICMLSCAISILDLKNKVENWLLCLNAMKFLEF